MLALQPGNAPIAASAPLQGDPSTSLRMTKRAYPLSSSWAEGAERPESKEPTGRGGLRQRRCTLVGVPASQPGNAPVAASVPLQGDPSTSLRMTKGPTALRARSAQDDETRTPPCHPERSPRRGRSRRTPPVAEAFDKGRAPWLGCSRPNRGTPPPPQAVATPRHPERRRRKPPESKDPTRGVPSAALEGALSRGARVPTKERLRRRERLRPVRSFDSAPPAAPLRSG